MHPRYTDKTIERIFAPEATLNLWYQIEQAITPSLPDERFNPPLVAHWEQLRKATGHEVHAFLELVDHLLSCRLDADSEPIRSARRNLHYGLTSSDLVDTATSLQMRDTTAYLDHLAQLLRNLPVFGSAAMVVARTHGVAAGVTTLGARLRAKFPTDLGAPAALQWYGKLNGAVGTRLGRDSDTEAAILRDRFDLRTTDTTQIIYRGHWVPVWSRWLAQVEACEAICTDLRLMWSYGELDTSTVTRVGSSAMPHKRNPIEAEQVCGLARVARGLFGALRESGVSWLERDLSSSSVERVCIPDLAHLAAHCLNVTRRLLSDLVLAAPHDPLGLADLSESLLLAATDLWDVPRLALHARLRRLTTRPIDTDSLSQFVWNLNLVTGTEVTVTQYLDRVDHYTDLASAQDGARARINLPHKLLLECDETEKL